MINLLRWKGWIDYTVPLPNVYSDTVSTTPVSQRVEGEDKLSEHDSDSEDDDSHCLDGEVEALSDDVRYRDSSYGYSRRRMKIHYDSGWFVGVIPYFNRKLLEYKVDFKDGSTDYVPEGDIGSMDVILM